MQRNRRLPDWLGTPLLFAALHAILILGALGLLLTPFAGVGVWLYYLVCLLDLLAVQLWDGQIATLVVLGSLQWFLIGLLVAIVARWIRDLIKRSS